MATSPHELTIRIINANGKGGGSGKNSSSASANPIESGGKAVDTAKTAISGTVIAREIRNGVIQAASHANTIVSLTTGNSISQERTALAINLGGKVASYGIAAIVNPAVALGMLLSDLASAGVGTILKADTINSEIAVERESLSLSRDRAGIAFNQSRMGGAK